MTLRLLDDAKSELEDAAHWYEDKRTGLGDEFLDTVERALEVIEEHPKRFMKLPVSHAEREVRRCVLKRFPYMVVYEVRSDEVLVVAIAHQKRKPGYWRNRLDG